MSIIYAFGDSITYGAWDISSSGWATRLRQYLDKRQEEDPDLYALFYNLGIPGETTEGLVTRFESETKARIRKNKVDDSIFILAYGANDAAYLPAEEKFRVSKEEFAKNLRQIIEIASSMSKKILIINLLPVVEEKNSTPRNGKVRSNKYMTEYNAVLKDLANQLKVPLVDVNSVFMKAGHESLFIADDGLHPNEAGHQLIFESVQPVVEKMLGWS